MFVMVEISGHIEVDNQFSDPTIYRRISLEAALRLSGILGCGSMASMGWPDMYGAVLCDDSVRLLVSMRSSLHDCCDKKIDVSVVVSVHFIFSPRKNCVFDSNSMLSSSGSFLFEVLFYLKIF